MKETLLLGLLFLFGAAVLSKLNHPITFKSIESKTYEGHAVFNEIRFKAEKDKDIWLMKQSHKGSDYPKEKWDEVKIVVYKEKRPFQVSYHQLKDGREIELKARCYTCHSNGPRLIRPYEKSMSFKDRTQVSLWNLKIKFYGPVILKNQKFVGMVRLGNEKGTEPLKVKSCLLCHNNNSWFGRGELKRLHANTISHLVGRGEMPPWPFRLSAIEKQELEGFVKGF